jgi:Putative transposase
VAAQPPRFLFAVAALSHVFRGKYLAGLRRLRAQHRLHFVGKRAAWAAEAAWTTFLRQVQDCSWVVYAKPPWGGPDQVLKSLSRYPHRVAIANSRLVFVGEGVVRFRYKDYRAGGAAKIMALQAEEFLRRFLLHVVPPHFVRIRHCGLVATRTRQEKLARCPASSWPSRPPRPLPSFPPRTQRPRQPAQSQPPRPSARPVGSVACALSQSWLPNEGSPHDQPRPLPVSLRAPFTTRAYPHRAVRSPLLTRGSPAVPSPARSPTARRSCHGSPAQLRRATAGRNLPQRRNDWQLSPNSLESP